MLSKSDVLGAIDLKVDYLGGASSIAEHGHNLVTVNQYELCAENTLESYEWWPMVHCMYGLQNCLNYNTTAEASKANQTCANAESGADDDLAQRCRDFVRTRILKAHAEGNLHSVDWGEERVPTAEELLAANDGLSKAGKFLIRSKGNATTDYMTSTPNWMQEETDAEELAEKKRKEEQQAKKNSEQADVYAILGIKKYKAEQNFAAQN